MTRLKYFFDWFEVFVYGIYGIGPMGKLVETIGVLHNDYMDKDKEENWTHLQNLNRGKLTEKEYWRKIIENTGWNNTPEQFINLSRQVTKNTIPGTPDIIRELKNRGHEVYLISDVWQEYKLHILSEFPWITQLFDKAFFSCDYGIIKSDPGFFELVLKETNTAPSEAVFVDDYYVNVDRAKAIGMNGIVFKDALQLRKDLNL